MTEETIKALATENAISAGFPKETTGAFEATFNDLNNVYSDGFLAGYKAALSGTEANPNYDWLLQENERLRETIDELYNAPKAGTERVECYLPCTFSECEIYAGTEAGALPLKLVTLTVIPNHQ